MKRGNVLDSLQVSFSCCILDKKSTINTIIGVFKIEERFSRAILIRDSNGREYYGVSVSNFLYNHCLQHFPEIFKKHLL